MQPMPWDPPVPLSPLAARIVRRIRRAKLFTLLREHRHELFDAAFQQELAATYRDSPLGQPPIPPAQLALAVLLAGNGSGAVSSNPAGINCGATCLASYSSGTVVTLTATPAAGSAFSGWSGACAGTGSCAVTVDGAKTVTATFAQVRQATALKLVPALPGDFHHPFTASAVLSTVPQNTPLSGQQVSLTLGSDVYAPTCSGTTDGTGTANCSLTPNQAAGSYTLTASFAGNAAQSLLGSAATTAFQVTLEETTLQYTGPTVFANSFPATLSGVLKEDATTPVAGRTVSFTLGSGSAVQMCTGVTDAAGKASCSLTTTNQPLGTTGTVKVDFAGDGYYLPATATTRTVVGAFATAAGGTFVVGDTSAGGNVTFWSAQWSSLNSLSGGAAPDSFKGFAATPSKNPPTCGESWTAGPGNSANPPSAVPGYLVVFVSSALSKSGSAVSGNIVQMVLVKTNAGYTGNPGYAGAGTVVGVLCSAP